jgi:hypothetical protein
MSQDSVKQTNNCPEFAMCQANANRLIDEVERARKDCEIADQLISRAFEAILDSLGDCKNVEFAMSWVDEIWRLQSFFNEKVEEKLNAFGRLSGVEE